MSKELALIQFKPNEKGLICEDESYEVESSGISQDLLDDIISKFGLDTRLIAEEYGSNEASTYEFIPNEKIKEILEYLDNRYVKEIEFVSDELGFFGKDSDSQQLIEKDKSLKTRARLRSFLNVFYLFELKSNQFGQDNYTFLKVRS